MYTTEDKLLYILIAATVIVGGVIGYFLFSMVRQFRHYQRLRESYDRAKIEALEKERQVIAADLHDDIGPLLSATLFKLSRIEPVTAKEQELLQEGRNHIDSIFSRLRELSSMLVPRSIERKGPLYALEEFNELYMRNQALEVQVIPVSCPGLSASRSLHLFRMLQEILHNAIRHSGATKLVVTGKLHDNGRLVIQTVDDGVGFRLPAITEHTGLGLQNLAIRAKMIGAEIRTMTRPGAGTRYRIELFLEDQ